MTNSCSAPSGRVRRGDKLNAAVRQVPLPGVQVIDQQGIMVAAVVRHDFLRPLANHVQLLILAEREPGPGKREGRPRNRLQPQHITIEGDALLDIGNVQSDVIELGDEHWQYFLTF